MKTLIIVSRATLVMILFCTSIQASHACGNLSDFTSLIFQAGKIKSYEKRVDCKIYAQSRLSCFDRVDARDRQSVHYALKHAKGPNAKFGTPEDPEKQSEIGCAADVVAKKFGIEIGHPNYATGPEQMTVGLLSSGSKQIDLYCGKDGVSPIDKSSAVHACLKKGP